MLIDSQKVSCRRILDIVGDWVGKEGKDKSDLDSQLEELPGCHQHNRSWAVPIVFLLLCEES